MTLEDLKLQRILQSEYLKLLWKISKYEKYLTLAEDKGKLFRDRIKVRLAQFETSRDKVWAQIVAMNKTDN